MVFMLLYSKCANLEYLLCDRDDVRVRTLNENSRVIIHKVSIRNVGGRAWLTLNRERFYSSCRMSQNNDPLTATSIRELSNKNIPY